MGLLSKLFGIGRKPAAALADPDIDEVVVPLNDLRIMLPALEKRKGSPLTEGEVIDCLDNAPSIVLRASRRDPPLYGLIDPENVWEDWQRYRAMMAEEEEHERQSPATFIGGPYSEVRAACAGGDTIPMFVPPLALVLDDLERRTGRALTEAEVLAARDSAPAIQMDREDWLDRMRSHCGDLNPDDVWPQWVKYRQTGELSWPPERAETT